MKKINRKIKIFLSFLVVAFFVLGIFWLGKKIGENQYWEDNKELKNKNLTNKVKVTLAGREENGDFTFGNAKWIPLTQMRKKLKISHVSKDHPRIKKLESEQKLQVGKNFIISFREADEIDGFYYTFYKNNELEIIER